MVESGKIAALAALLVVGLALPSASAGTGAEGVLRKDMSAKWKAAGTDPASVPDKFDCAVKVGLAAFTPEELATLEDYARVSSFAGFSASEDAIKARDARVDMKALTFKECGEVPGFDPLL